MWFELPSPPVPHTSIVSKLPLQSHMLLNSQKPSAPQQGYLTFSECNAHFKFLFFCFTIFNSFYLHLAFQPFQILRVFVKLLHFPHCSLLLARQSLSLPLRAPGKLCLVFYYSLPLIPVSMHNCFPITNT